jgi:hypothetical protein
MIIHHDVSLSKMLRFWQRSRPRILGKKIIIGAFTEPSMALIQTD